MKKSLLGVGLAAVIATFALLTPRKVNSSELKKYARCHNGVLLCLPEPAYQAHMRQHELIKKSFDCIPLPYYDCDNYQGAKGRNAGGCNSRPAAD